MSVSVGNRWLLSCWILACSALMVAARPAHGEGEPAADFLKRLRAAKYFDIAISYLDRLDEFPGVDPNLLGAIPLEKAQTYIDAAVASRNPKTRDEYFVQAEEQLSEFLNSGTHARTSEARLQLGKLQMVRAAQLLNGQPDDQQRTKARESYLAAASTFDSIEGDLRGKLAAMQGAKIDPAKEPEKAALRDQYRGEFLQAKINSGEARRLAAQTFDKPAEQGKELLQQALAQFTELSDKYDGYVQGVMAFLYRGQTQEDLGMKQEAVDSYIRMLEQPENDALRDSKFQATSGMIRLWLAEEPPKFAQAINRGQGMIDDARPDERRTSTIQELRIELAQAYLLKSKDTESQKPADIKRAESAARQLLLAASKVPSDHLETAKAMLADLGIRDDTVAELPKAEDPDDLVDAIDKAQQLVAQAENLAQSLELLNEQDDPDGKLKPQIAELEKQLTETRSIAIQILRRGLAMVDPDVDIEILNQARQFLAYLLYQNKNYRDAAVVGTFLARYAPGTELGLSGGAMALNSYQLLLNEVSAEANEGLIVQLQELGDYLVRTWPNDPKAAAAQGMRVRIALSKNRWEEAQELVEKMPAGSERAEFERLMGQLHWNESVKARKAEDEQASEQQLSEAQTYLQQGLDGIPTELVPPEAVKAALILVKVYLRQDNVQQAAKVLDHPKYGPTTLVAKQGPPDDGFLSDMYAAQLQVIMQMMTSDDANSEELLKRAGEVMDKLRQSVAPTDAQSKLTAIYFRLARDIREQLDAATAAKKTKLIDAFRILLDRIAKSTTDSATLQWGGNTLLEMGESSMQPSDITAKGQAAELLTSAVSTLEGVAEDNAKAPLTVHYQLGRAYRLLGEYKKSIDAMEKVLIEKPAMLDAQIEAAQAYENWAAEVKPKYQDRAYKSALMGARPGPDKKNRIWGWGKISQLTQRDPKFKDMFFNARYHIALCRYKQGLALKNDRVKEQAIKDIENVVSLHPALGGPAQKNKFEVLIRAIQKDLGKPVTGLTPPKKS